MLLSRSAVNVRAYTIHLPDKNGQYYTVKVKPNKLYGGRLGRDLIQLYGNRNNNTNKY